MEVWKDIENHIGKYQISNLGRVKSLARHRETKIPYFIEERILKQTVSMGYLYVKLGKSGSKSIHRLVASAFSKNDNKILEVNHIDGNKLNNIATNLEWCTHQENMQHAHIFGLIAHKGVNNPNAKLTKDDVIAIRSIGKSLTIREISSLYHIGTTQVWKILNNKCW